MATDYRTLLAQPAEEAIRVAGPLPVGHYIGTLGQLDSEGKSKAGNARLRWPCALEAACTDVDENDLAGIDVTKRNVNVDIYVTPFGLGRLGKMINAVLGPKPGTNMDERIPELRGQKVMIQLGQQQMQNSEDMMNEVLSVIAAP